MYAEDENACCVLFNSTYDLVKQVRHLSDLRDLLKLQEKNFTPGIKECYRNDRAAGNFLDVIGKVKMDSLQKDLANAHYFCVFSDGSTDRSVIEEELVYLLFLKSEKPLLKFLSIEPTNNANAESIIECIKTAFQRTGILDFPKRIMRLNVDGASVSTGVHNRVGVLMQADSPWLQVIQCFNHRLELAIKDAFKDENFNKIDDMLVKFYYLYQKSPKRLQELKRIAEAWEKSVRKPSKSYGTRWIDHKLTSMKIMLESYGAYISYVESLSQTDSQALKRANLKGYLLKWKDIFIPISFSIYLDVLSPLK